MFAKAILVKSFSIFAYVCHFSLCICAAASGEVKVVIRPLVVEQVNGVSLPASSDSDTSSESDTAEITDINEMREIISRMDDDDDGDHEK